LLFVEWCEEYKTNVVNKTELQQEVDEYMLEYDEKVQEVSLLVIVTINCVFINCPYL